MRAQAASRMKSYRTFDANRAYPQARFPFRFAELCGFLRQNRRRRGRLPKGAPQLNQFSSSNADSLVPFCLKILSGPFFRSKSKGTFDRGELSW